jgi:hypothetical protein
MKYKIAIYKVLDAYVAVVSTWDEDPYVALVTRQLFTIPTGGLKQDDLPHLLEHLFMQVSEITA